MEVMDIVCANCGKPAVAHFMNAMERIPRSAPSASAEAYTPRVVAKTHPAGTTIKEVNDELDVAITKFFEAWDRLTYPTKVPRISTKEYTIERRGQP